jgi:hypothetical protein
MISRWILLWMRTASEKSCRKNKNTHFVQPFFRKSCRLWDKVEKCCRAREVTDNSTAHAFCMLDNYGYRRTLRVWITYCFSTATIARRTRLDVVIRTLPVLLICVQHMIKDTQVEARQIQFRTRGDPLQESGVMKSEVVRARSSISLLSLINWVIHSQARWTRIRLLFFLLSFSSLTSQLTSQETN